MKKIEKAARALRTSTSEIPAPHRDYKIEAQKRNAQVPKTSHTKVTLRLIPEQLRILVCLHIPFDVIVLENIRALVENTDAPLELKKKDTSTGQSRMTSREGPDSEITHPQWGQALQQQPDRG